MGSHATNAIVWRWDSDPFGVGFQDGNANDEPGRGDYAFDLRFPGQQFFEVTGRHYNYFRDYDPWVGRYGESDPIGLDGGANTYSYVGQNPVIRIDASGEAWQLPILFCARFPRICKEIADCSKNPSACKAKFCSAGNAIYKSLCINKPCRPGDTCTTLGFKQQAAEGCVAGRTAVSTFCYPGKSDSNHQREISEAMKKAAECEGLMRRKNCPGCD